MELTPKTLGDEVVLITSPTTIPKNQDIVISWKTDNQEIRGYEIRIGMTPGKWDLFSSRLRTDLREIRLPGLPQNMTSLYVEFGYIVPYIPLEGNEVMDDHESSQNVLLCGEPLEISRI